jgi:plastocyanin
MTVRTLVIVAAVAAVAGCGQSTIPTGPSASQVQAAISTPSGPSSVTVAIGTNNAGTGSNTGGGSAAPGAEFFSPDSVTISPGMQVNFVNNDTFAHALAADDGSWSTGNMDSEGTYSVTFPNAGTFRYHDTAHPEIGGTVIVQ